MEVGLFQKKLPSRKFCSVETSAPVETEIVQSALNRLPNAERIALNRVEMPGPTGESNRLSFYPRGTVLCLGPTPDDALAQAKIAEETGCSTLIVCPGVNDSGAIAGFLKRSDLAELAGIDLVALWSDEADLRQARKALAEREGVLVPLHLEQSG